MLIKSYYLVKEYQAWDISDLLAFSSWGTTVEEGLEKGPSGPEMVTTPQQLGWGTTEWDQIPTITPLITHSNGGNMDSGRIMAFTGHTAHQETEYPPNRSRSFPTSNWRVGDGLRRRERERRMLREKTRKWKGKKGRRQKKGNWKKKKSVRLLNKKGNRRRKKKKCKYCSVPTFFIHSPQ